MMPSSRDLLLLFISLELVSAPGFLMAAFRKGDLKSNEAGLKFFLIGVLSTAVMLYGMSLIYGLTGATRLDEIAVKLAPTSPAAPGDAGARARSCSWWWGSRSRCRAFPFQFWAPDTYEGAPVPVAAFLAVASSAAGFAGLLQLMFVAFIDQSEFWVPIFAFLSIATMTLGQPGGAEADAGGAAARVLGDRAGRLHPAAVRAGHGRRRRRTAPRSRRRSPTS